MPRRNNAIRRASRLPPFVPLTWEMLNHKAYKELPFAASKALPYFLGKVKMDYNAPNRLTTEFSFSYSEAKLLGFANATFSKVITDLVKYGFIDPKDRGGLRGECRTYSFFCLSERWKLYGQEGFLPVNWKCFFPRQKSLQKVKRITSIYEKNGISA